MKGRHHRRHTADQLSVSEIQKVAQCFKDWQPFSDGRSVRAERAELARIRELMTAAANCILAQTSGDPDLTGETPIKTAWRRINCATDNAAAERKLTPQRVNSNDVVEILVR